MIKQLCKGFHFCQSEGSKRPKVENRNIGDGLGK